MCKECQARAELVKSLINIQDSVRQPMTVLGEIRNKLEKIREDIMKERIEPEEIFAPDGILDEILSSFPQVRKETTALVRGLMKLKKKGFKRPKIE